MASLEDTAGIFEATSTTSSTPTARGRTAKERRTRESDPISSRASSSSSSSSSASKPAADAGSAEKPIYNFGTRPRLTIFPRIGVVYHTHNAVIETDDLPGSFIGQSFTLPISLGTCHCLQIPNSIGEYECDAWSEQNLSEPIDPTMRVFTAGALRIDREYFAFVIVAPSRAKALATLKEYLEAQRIVKDDEIDLSALPLSDPSIHVLLNSARLRHIDEANSASASNPKRKRTNDYDYKTSCSVAAFPGAGEDDMSTNKRHAGALVNSMLE